MTAPAPTSHRLHRPERTLALAGAVTVLALAVTGCGGDAEDPDTGTPVSTQSSTQSESPQPGGSENPGSPDGSTESSAPTPEPSGGEFVPASSEGPAQNVPVPEMPAAAKEQTQEGLEAALEYWWETSFYLRTTGDTEPMERVSDSSCAFCEDQIVRFGDVYDQGSWVETGPSEVAVQYTNLDEQGGTTAFLISETAVELYRSTGERVPEASGAATTEDPWTASGRFDDEAGHWVIDDIKFVGELK